MTDQTYSGYDCLEIMEQAVVYNRFLIKTVAQCVQAGSSIVDFGAGRGLFAGALNAFGHDVLCTEPDHLLRTGLADRGLRTAAALEELPDGSVDFIYSLTVLEHIEDDSATIRLWQRKLKPQGRLLLYVPAFQCLFSAMDRKVGHFRRYTSGSLSPLILGNGFQINSVRYVYCLGFFAAYLYRFTSSDEGSINRRGLIVYDRMVFPVSRMLDLLFRRFFGKNLLIDARSLPSQ
jgi:SAM-dependent methyltransferase